MRLPVAGTERSGRSMVFAFAATMALSALLLFSVQPMVAKMLLPVLGGAPATWAVALCFFQALLLLGYAYAHVLGSRLSTGWSLLTHAGLLAAAFALLPIGLPAGLSPPEGNPYLWLMAMLAAMSGLPFFTLSANAPLLQLWFGRIGHARSPDPYFLYAASNGGSLVALLAYPTLIEPLFALPLQSRLWSSGFLLLVLAIAGCGLITLQRERTCFRLPPASGQAAPARLTWGRRLALIGLAFVPSGLLIAYTTYLTTDLASAPLLWVLPLALYLATFIATFRKRPLLNIGVLLALQPLVVAAALAAVEWQGDYSWAAAALLGLLAFAITSLICHTGLYQLRPEAPKLTDYYLSISLGGVLGGIFAALLAPLLFTGTLEFPLLLGLGMLGRPQLWRTPNAGRGLLRLALLVAAAVGSIL